MGDSTSGEYISLVVRLQAAADGAWYVHIDSANSTHTFALAPMTLVMRLWRAGPVGPVRGSIRLHGSDSWAPIQSNDQLEALVRAWLLSSERATEPQ